MQELYDKVRDALNDEDIFSNLYHPTKVTVPLDSKNFKDVIDLASDKSIAFVDGGCAEIIKTPSFSLQLIRVASVHFKNNKKVNTDIKEFYTTISAKKQGDRMCYQIDFFKNQKESMLFDSFDETIRQGSNRISLGQMGNVIRRFLEIHCASNQDSDIIILDGDLTPKVTGEQKYLQKLLESSKTVLGLSKTSDLITESGQNLFPVLSKASPDGSWIYHPLIQDESLSVVKLHKNSKFLFKLESNNRDTEEALSLLKKNAADPIFLGYPYGLVEADRAARVTNVQVGYLKTTILAKIKKDISDHVNTQGAHDILDSISF